MFLHQGKGGEGKGREATQFLYSTIFVFEGIHTVSAAYTTGLVQKLSNCANIMLYYSVLFNLAMQYENNEMYTEALNTYQETVQ